MEWQGRDPYLPPECGIYLQGEVQNHPEFEDGQRVTTSLIVAVNGPRVTTHSGTQYELVNPAPAFLDWCHNHYGPGWTFDPANPIRT